MSAQVMSGAADFVDYLNAAVTGYHSVTESSRRLVAAGFLELDEREATWQLEKAGKYFYTRNGSALVAFAVGGQYDAAKSGACIIGAHTDSPCPKLKPTSALEKDGNVMLGVVGYGGGLWHTWFDRDLSVAGKVLVKDEATGKIEAKLVHIKRPICRIPTLAIHLLTADERSKGFLPNLQNHMPPLLATTVQEALWPATKEESHLGGRQHPLLVRLVAEELGCAAGALVDFELQLVDTQPACVGGALEEFVFSGRLDNQGCCYFGIQALIDACSTNHLAKSASLSVVALFDHEEVGSCSATGAEGPLLRDALLRIPNSLSGAVPLDFGAAALRARSLIISADMAHAQHPNYGDRHDGKHNPKLRGGLVIKHNANQRYATEAVGASFLRLAADRAKLKPCQEFAVKADCACGSTIGPISASNLGVRTVDVGAPMLSMHSIREMCAVEDVDHSVKLLTAALVDFPSIAATLL